MSVRAPLSDVWQCWPVCERHVSPLSEDLAGLFVVTAGYRLADLSMRRRLEDQADDDQAAGVVR